MLISSLCAHVLHPNGEWKWVNIKQSPYYQTLVKNDAEAFNEYNALLKKHTPPENYNSEISYEQFIELKNNIHIKWDAESVVNIKESRIYDGQHRLSILLYLLGDIEIEIDPSGRVSWE